MKQGRHQVRFVTAAALFDGHDAAINIIRRLLVVHGAEVIHLGHNRSVAEIVDAAIQEDAQGIAVSSYQGGHMEFFRYMVDLLRERGSGHVKVFGGGGGVIVPAEAAELHAYGVARIFTPDDGSRLGLDGMILEMIRACDGAGSGDRGPGSGVTPGTPLDFGTVAHLLTQAENGIPPEPLPDSGPRTPVVGITGPGGAGKSSLTDELLRRFLLDLPDLRVAVLAVDPTKRKTGGALLGDRIRMNALDPSRVLMRSLATRRPNVSVSAHLGAAIAVCQQSGFDLVIVESAGAGQADSAITDLAGVTVYVMTPEYGAALQLEKIDMLDFADLIAVNKFDRPGALDALRDVRKQWRRSRNDFSSPEQSLPVFATCAHQFHDRGVNALYRALLAKLGGQGCTRFDVASSQAEPAGVPERHPLIPADRTGYLRDISRACRGARQDAAAQADVARRLFQLVGARAMLQPAGEKGKGRTSRAADRAGAGHAELWSLLELVEGGTAVTSAATEKLDQEIRRHGADLAPETRKGLAGWPELMARYGGDELAYEVRGREVRQQLTSLSLSGTRIPRVVVPTLVDWGEIVLFLARENVPGDHPYTAGVFPLRRQEETPTRMFAGEGGPEQTNRRFHYLSRGQSFVRLSTAFDSVTLYGEDPDERPDVWGKVGESGVSICTVEDMERLYAGFDLGAPNSSVSMTINGPAPMILAMFFNVAGRQEARRRLIADGRLAGRPEDALQPEVAGKGWEEIASLLRPGEWADALSCAMQKVRGTVQADILKEDQAQNTCIFSTEFALRMMGDIQAAFIEHGVRNFYSVSISGYHIAEAGANPISQLAFTLANGFTYVEHYLSRGMRVDDFAPNLSFFFSNGMDPEYTVIGRVARRIWANAVTRLYAGSDRAAKLKYHIQTSGRSLHAREVDFNDIRTTLQGLLALADACNSLHTNAYDEAITTPTEESVRRALAIQLINAQEFGLLKNEAFWQGSYFVEWLTDKVEEAVLEEFDRLAERGGVLGAMETGYQRSRIQEESLHYERLKHEGLLPIVGVNTFLDPTKGENALEVRQLTRATPEEKNARVAHVREFQKRHRGPGTGVRGPEDGSPWLVWSDVALVRLQEAARSGGNVFVAMLDAVCSCSLGQISHALYEVGGQYRRSM